MNILDLLSMIIGSFYYPIIQIERVIMNSIIVMLNLSSICFIFFKSIFILTITYDLKYIKELLQIKYDLEFFIGDEDNKFIIKT